MIYLGINTSHGASASLMVNGKIIISIQEERLTNIKNFHGYPKKSIDFCLKYIKKNKLKIDIAAFTTCYDEAFGHKYPFGHFFEIEDYQKYYGEEYYVKKIKNKSVEKYLKKLSLDKRNTADLYLPLKEVTGKNLFNQAFFIKMLKKFLLMQGKDLIDKITFLDHHSCHAHYAFYYQPNRNRKSAVVTLDSDGDNMNQTVWIYDVKLDKIVRKQFSNQCDLARVYKLVTLILKMKPDEHEYKVMGLAPYAKKSYSLKVYNEVFKNLLKVKDMKVLYKNRPKDLYLYLSEKTKPYRFDNIAAAAQMFVEDIAIQVFKQINKKFASEHFYLSGGVSMNVKMNKEILGLKFVKSLSVPPCGTDDSLSIGACYYLAVKKKEKRIESLKNIYLGRSISIYDTAKKIEKYFDNNDYKIISNFTHKQIAQLINKNYPVAIARDREEFGARALGNRSIIANPADYSVIKIINESIKNRDFWMPFALTILKKDHRKYIINPKNNRSEHMTIAFDTVSKNYKHIIAGTHPYDRTVRPQILDRSENPNFYSIISEFKKLSGVPALLNTSLNLHGNPISSSIEDVIKTFKYSGLKYLYINDKILIKKLR